MISPIETANWATTRMLRKVPEPEASAVDLFANYAGRASEMKAYLADAQINHDRDLRLQYLAGLGLNLYQSGPIYAEILRHKKYPEGLFTGSPETMQRLRAAIASAPGGDAQTQ